MTKCSKCTEKLEKIVAYILLWRSTDSVINQSTHLLGQESNHLQNHKVPSALQNYQLKDHETKNLATSFNSAGKAVMWRREEAADATRDDRKRQDGRRALKQSTKSSGKKGWRRSRQETGWASEKYMGFQNSLVQLNRFNSLQFFPVCTTRHVEAHCVATNPIPSWSWSCLIADFSPLIRFESWPQRRFEDFPCYQM